MRWVCLLLSLSLVTAAWADHDMLFPRLIGEWQSNGDAFGGPAKTVMTWKKVLNGQFVQLEYRIEMQRGEGQVATFEGMAYYKASSESQPDAFWADNSGFLHPISAERDGDALIAHWGSEGKKQGRSRYELIGPDKMLVTDWVKNADGWRQFNQNEFVRVVEALVR